MDSVNLYNLASQQARWVAVRQKAVASNIANVNTTGFRTVDVAAFKESLASGSSTSLAATDSRHLKPVSNEGAFRIVELERDALTGTEPKVRMEHELMKAGAVRRDYEMNTAIVKAFHRMFMMTARP